MTKVLALNDLRTKTGRTSLTLRRAAGAELRRLRNDAGLSLRAVARAARISPSHLSAIERGSVEASLAVLVAVADVLGANVSVRVFPETGPRIRDRIQAPIVEALMRAVHPTWKRLVEVPVRSPARGVIDAVFVRPGEVVVATEVHSDIQRLEQQLRWIGDKAVSLPSSEAWTMLTDGGTGVRIERLLVLRNTRAHRLLAQAFEETLRSAYPASARFAYESLLDPSQPFPGSAVLWCDLTNGRARLLDRPPRGVALGR